eukprot:Amastigsp_a512685_14.p4 type:complete len:122 gc:universal Amastigsp_a512685_14:1503-1138(-)
MSPVYRCVSSGMSPRTGRGSRRRRCSCAARWTSSEQTRYHPTSTTAARAERGRSRDRNGTTCGLTCETTKWLTAKSSERRCIGRSAWTEPSMNRVPARSHGTKSGSGRPGTSRFSRISTGA